MAPFNAMLYEDELVYSYGRHFWRRRTLRPSISYGSSDFKWDVVEEKPSISEILKVSQWIT
jgi:hypothetical protein